MPIHILIVEDASSIADNLVYAFESEDLQVTWKHLGSEVKELLQGQLINLVVLDVGSLERRKIVEFYWLIIRIQSIQGLLRSFL